MLSKSQLLRTGLTLGGGETQAAIAAIIHALAEALAQMVSESIPDDVREFVQKYIDSIAQLEALLLLRREISAPWNDVDGRKATLHNQ